MGSDSVVVGVVFESGFAGLFASFFGTTGCENGCFSGFGIGTVSVKNSFRPLLFPTKLSEPPSVLMVISKSSRMAKMMRISFI